MIKSLNSLIKIRTRSAVSPAKKQNDIVNNFFDAVPTLSYKALAIQVKAMAEADNNSKLGTKLNIVV